MKLSDFISALVAYSLFLAGGIYLVLQQHLLKPDWLFSLCGFLVCILVAYRYHGRDLAPAPFSAKALTGVYLAILATGSGVLCQEQLHWVDLPEYNYVITAVISYLMPFFVFNGIQHVRLHNRD